MTLQLLTKITKHLGKLLQLVALLFDALQKPFKTYRLILPLLALIFATNNGWGQCNVANYFFTASTETYPTLSGTTNVGGQTASNDDDLSNTLVLPFTFTFSGSNYTDLQVSSNGFITFGNGTGWGGNAKSNTSANLTDGTRRIFPFWDDIANTIIPRYVISGSSPNRIFKIEWSSKWSYAASAAAISYQLWLYESTNVIEFYYKQESGAISTTTTTTFGASIGISDGTNYLSLSGSNSNPSASSSSFTSNITSKPATDQKYKFSPTPNDPGFGTNAWNVICYNAGDASGGSNAWNANNYRGFYTINSLSFDTRTGQTNSTAQSWGDANSPSSASGYSGCTIGVDNHSYIFKRQGFTCGTYQLNIPSHDDIAILFIDGKEVWRNTGCCATRTAVWTGYLGSTSTVELRISEGSGGSHGALEFVSLPISATLTGTNPTTCGGSGSIAISNVQNGYRSVFTSDFSSTPAGATIYGNASVTGGELILTTATNSQMGSALLTPSYRSGSWIANYTQYIGGGGGADGLSFTYGPISGAANGASGAGGENGWSSGLVISFDTWNGSSTSSQLIVYWNGTLLTQNTAGSQNFRTASYLPVKITVNTSNQLTVTWNTIDLITNYTLPAAYVSADKSAWNFGFAARTGGVNDLHKVSDVYISTNANLEYSTDGSTWTTTTPLSRVAGSYTVQARPVGISCVNSNIGTVTLSNPSAPSAPTAGGASRCGTGTVTITATPGAGQTIDWYGATSGGSILTTGSPNPAQGTSSFTTPSISSTTTYYAEARNTTSGCVSATRTAVTATVIAPVSITASSLGAQSACQNSIAFNPLSVTVSGTSPSYQWQSSPDGSTNWTNVGANSSAYTPPNSTLGTTYFRCIISGASPCTSVTSSVSGAITVSAPAPTSVSAGVTTASICEGNTVSLQGTATGASAWSWFGPNGFTSSSEDPSIANALPAATGTYFLTASNSCGTGTGLFDNFNDGNYTNHLAAWTAQAGDFSAASNYLQGTNTDADDRISTSSTQAYGRWQFDFTLAATGNTADVVRFMLMSSGAGLWGAGINGYFVRASAAGTSGIQLFRYTGTSTTALGSADYTPNTSARTIVVTRTPGNIFRVYLDGVLLITSAADNTYTTSTHAGVWTTGNAATVNHIVDNISCSSTSVDVTVNALPTAVTVSTAGSYCSSTTLTASNGSSGTIYWQNTTSGGTSTATASTSQSVSSSGTYYFRAQSAAGCWGTQGSAVVTINAPISITASSLATQSTCQNGTAFNALSVTATGTTPSYQWQYSSSSDGSSGWTTISSGGTSSTYTPPNATAGTLYYRCQVSGASPCATVNSSISGAITVNATPSATASNSGPFCSAGNISLSSSGGASYSWSGPNSFTSTSQNPTRAASGNGGTYTVTVTSASSCTATATTSVTVNSSPSASASNAGPYCSSGTITLSSSGGTTFSWAGPNGFSSSSQNPTLSANGNGGTYTVTVSSASSCTATATTSVTVNANPTATASNGGPYCATGTISLSSSGGATYSWSGPATFSSTSQNPTRSASGNGGTYTVTVTDANNCTATATTSVTVNANPTASASNTGPYCESGTISLSSSGGTTYSWSGPATFSSTSQNPTRAASGNGGTYTVTVTDANSCTATATTSVTVNPNLAVSVSISSNDADNAICSGTSVIFTATPTNGGTTPVYQWKLNNFNVGTNSSSYTNGSLANNDQVTVTLTSNATCATGSPATSNTITTTVSSPSVGGTATATSSIINSGTSTSISLSGNTGTIQWEQSANNSTWSNVSGGSGATTATYTTPNLTSTAYYRAQVQNSPCAATSSSTATVTVVSAVITVNGSFSTFTSCTASNSAAQTFTVSGTGMVAGITITPPVGYEVSTSASFTSAGSNSSPITVGTSGTIAATTIYVRSTTSASSGAGGNIVCSSSGASSQNVATGSLTINPDPVAPTINVITPP